MNLFDRESERIPNSRIFFLFLLILVIVYSNSFQASWQLDDKPNILKNPRIQLSQFSAQPIIQTAFAKPGSGGFYRPVACISLALNWYFGQDNVFGYHVVNFLIHCLTAWFLFLTIRTLFSTPRLRDNYNSGQIWFVAVVAALLWALNPIHVQAVTYIVQRMTSMAAMFSILAVFFYLKARLSEGIKKRSFFLIFAAFNYVLALLSKENAITVILFLPIFEFLFFEHRLSRSFISKAVAGILLGSLISLLAGMALHPELFDFVINYYDNRPFTMFERLLTEQRILLFYLSQLFFPSPERLSIEHDIILSTSLINPWTTIAAITVNFLLILFAIKLYKKQPLISLSILFFFLNHIVESTIVPLELVFEHRNYLPSMFLFLPLAQGFNRILTRVRYNRLKLVSFIAFLSLVLATEGYAVYLRNKAWQTEETLWLDAAVKAPNSARPLTTLAIKLAWGPNPNEKNYRRALKLMEHTLSMRMARKRLDATQLDNMASIHSKLGDHRKAILYYEKALMISPQDASIRYNLSKTFIMAGDFPRAEEELKKIVDNGFVHADYFNMLGFIKLWAGKPEEALPFIQQALKYAPGRPDILLTFGKCLSLLGYHDKAKWYYSLSRQKGRNDAVISLCIIENAIIGGNASEAQNEFKYMIAQFPLAQCLQVFERPDDERYREVPLNAEILIPYIQSELSKTASQLFLIKNESNE
jgi:tetratricopeptide (TPR) repeat protein